MIKWKQENMGFKDYGLDFTNPDFVKYAEVYGATGHRVESTEQLMTLANSAFASGGVHLIEVPADYSDNDRVLHHEISQLSKAVEKS